jgi:photosystem II stability/assembly factor-like uncharacterized protein
MAYTLTVAVWLAAVRPAAAQSSDGDQPSRFGQSSAVDQPAQVETIPTPAVKPATRSRVEDEAARDDANLHDVCFVGSDGWSVGDRGAIWRTLDGGRTWKSLPSPTDCALRSVCFLTDHFGWVAGGSTTPYSRVGAGVILATRDGGKTWTSLARGSRPLPRLHFVRFFSPSDGVVAGERTSDFPTGVMTTADAGKTWQPVEGPSHDGWRAADFLSPTVGVVAGLEGEAARVDAGRVVGVRAGRFGLRGLYDVKLARDDSGWMVGDEGLILRTHNRGVVWETPAVQLPKETREIFNFRTVAVRGTRLWIAGSPGSIIWHSPDAGHSWRPQTTGQTAPLERVAFSTDLNGCAVGAFGCVLHTEDGGQTWEPARAARRRAALLAVNSRPDRISFSALAKESGELGYRSVVLLPVRGQAEGEGARDPELDLKIHDAVTVAGGSQGVTGWRFPLDVPGLDRDPEKLVADWMRRTEGKFQPMFYGNLVCQLRTWRPTVVVLDQPAPDDAAATVLANAVLSAVRQAGDPSAFEEQARIAALLPWTTSRVFMRLPVGNAGDFRLSVHEILPRRGSSVMNLAAAGASRLIPVETVVPESEPYRLVDVAPDANGGNSAAPALNDFFTGIGLGPGTDARRSLRTVTAESNEQAQRVARRDRDFRKIIRQRVQSSTGGAELLGMLHEETSGSDNASAALQLVLLADAYRKNSQWELAEAALLDLVDRFPDEPATFHGMQWLFQYWTSAELTYQRLQKESVKTTRLHFTPSLLRAKLDKALAQTQIDPQERDPTALEGPDPLSFVTQSKGLRLGKSDMNALRRDSQRDSALKMAALICRKSPALYRTPAIQFPLAALLREAGMRALPSEPGDAAGVIQASGESDTNKANSKNGVNLADAQLAERTPQKIVVCRAATERLKADGMLSDACWQEATEIPLSTNTIPLAGDAAHAFVMLTHDAEYLYFAASVPRVAGLPKDGPMTLGRKHDQDLSAYDRISLFFDVDRDGMTWYEIDIDQRGCIAESCCDDRGWDPPLYVAAQGDDERWRIEGAIPFTAMVPNPPRAGDSWGLAIVRTAPAVTQEAWNPPASTRPRPESFGLLRFQ